MRLNLTQTAYAYPVRAGVANGTVTRIKTAAEKSGGVLVVLTHENAARLRKIDPQEIQKNEASFGEDLIPLQDDKVHYYGQFVALVVAETYEQGRCAANLVEIEYAAEKPKIDLRAEAPNGSRPEKTILGTKAQINKGKAAAPLAAAPFKFEQTYTTPTEVHNPLEPHAMIAVWDNDGKLFAHDATQGAIRSGGALAYVFNLEREDVHVTSPFLGGGFGTNSNATGSARKNSAGRGENPNRAQCETEIG